MVFNGATNDNGPSLQPTECSLTTKSGSNQTQGKVLNLLHRRSLGKLLKYFYISSSSFPFSWSGSNGGRAVASNTSGLRFESSHRQTLYCLYTVNWIEKTKIMLNRPEMAIKNREPMS